MSSSFCRFSTIHRTFSTRDVCIPVSGPLEETYFDCLGPLELDHYSMIKEVFKDGMERSIIRFYRYAGKRLSTSCKRSNIRAPKIASKLKCPKIMIGERSTAST